MLLKEVDGLYEGFTNLRKQQFACTFFSSKQNKDDHVIKTGKMIGYQRSEVNISTANVKYDTVISVILQFYIKNQHIR